ncbi:MAG: hypothetical protein WDN04_23705 [Rhodospirillales bacterium]
MSAIFKLLNVDGYDFCHPLAPQDFETINLLINAVERARNWVPLAMEVVDVDEGRQLKKADALWLGCHALMFRPPIYQ